MKWERAGWPFMGTMDRVTVSVYLQHLYHYKKVTSKSAQLVQSRWEMPALNLYTTYTFVKIYLYIREAEDRQWAIAKARLSYLGNICQITRYNLKWHAINSWFWFLTTNSMMLFSWQRLLCKVIGGMGVLHPSRENFTFIRQKLYKQSGRIF